MSPNARVASAPHNRLLTAKGLEWVNSGIRRSEERNGSFRVLLHGRTASVVRFYNFESK